MIENKLEKKSGWLIGAGIFASLVASLCCIGPLVLTLLGVSGAAALSRFEGFRIPMILLVLVFFSVAGFLLFRKRNSCESESICADPGRFRKMVIFYWIGLVIALFGIALPHWIAWIFP